MHSPNFQPIFRGLTGDGFLDVFDYLASAYLLVVVWGSFHVFLERSNRSTWLIVEVFVILIAFVALSAAFSQIQSNKLDEQINGLVAKAQSDFRRIERGAEFSMIACGLWWNEVITWELVPRDNKCVLAVGGIPTACAACRIGHLTYQERGKSLLLAHGNNDVLSRSKFLYYNFMCDRRSDPHNLTDAERREQAKYTNICPAVKAYTESAERLKGLYERLKTSWFMSFGNALQTVIQYLIAVSLGMQLAMVTTELARIRN